MIFQELYDDLKKLLSPLYGVREAGNIVLIYFEDRFGVEASQASRQVTPTQFEAFRKDRVALLDGVPVQYVLGKAFFFNSFFKVTPDVLIPRPETEELVAQIINRLKKRKAVQDIQLLDIGTGSGCIPVTIKKLFPRINFTAIDISEAALEIAKFNAKSLNVDIDFIALDFLDESKWSSLPEYDIIISNPPYIDLSEKSLMPEHVLAHEPEIALFPEHVDPLIFYKKVFEFAEERLKPDGEIFMEINEYSKDALAELLMNFPAYKGDFYTDLQGKLRVLHVLPV